VKLGQLLWWPKTNIKELVNLKIFNSGLDVEFWENGAIMAHHPKNPFARSQRRHNIIQLHGCCSILYSTDDIGLHFLIKEGNSCSCE
jgi:hypothetical protein